MSLFTEQKINISACDLAPIQELEVFGDASIAGSVSIDSSLSVAGSIKSSAGASALSSGVGYATGAGGAVTQVTSRTTGVSINALCGAITLVSAAGPAGTDFSFTVTNSAVAASDVIVVSQKSGTDLYVVQAVTDVAAGSFQLTLNSAGSTVEQPVFSFAIIKAVTA